MLVGPEHLSPGAFGALAELERAVVAADGGRLKLEWPTLEAGDRAAALLWWEGKQLAGFVGLYAFTPEAIELAGMVAPGWRRHGIGTTLLRAGLAASQQHGCERPLLVVPRSSVGGKELAIHFAGVMDHSEHALVLTGAPHPQPEKAKINLRRAGSDDAVQISRLLEEAFGQPAPGFSVGPGSEQELTLVIERHSSTVGTLRVTRRRDEAGIYGFAVDPLWQGQGIGRAALYQLCRQLREEGARRIGIEVAVDNDRALGLYTSIGFTAVTTEDYYAIPTAGAPNVP